MKQTYVTDPDGYTLCFRGRRLELIHIATYASVSNPEIHLSSLQCLVSREIGQAPGQVSRRIPLRRSPRLPGVEKLR